MSQILIDLSSRGNRLSVCLIVSETEESQQRQLRRDCGRLLKEVPSASTQRGCQRRDMDWAPTMAPEWDMY